VPQGEFLELGSIRQKGGKTVYAWAFAGDHDDSRPITSNTFELQWPPRSVRMERFPEVDQARFFSLPEAKRKLKESQWPLVERLVRILQDREK